MLVIQEHLHVFCVVDLAGNIKNVKVTGDKSLSKRDFSRVVKPLELFGINIKTKKE